MKIIRNLVTLAGLSIVVFALGGMTARAQSFGTNNFAGTFTLPFETHWGSATLPAGEYKLYYGRLYEAGPALVEVVGKENWRPRVFILPQGVDDASEAKSTLVCIREGGVGIVRALEMPEIGKAARFKIARGLQLMAQQRNGDRTIQIAGGPMLIQRIAVTPKQK